MVVALNLYLLWVWLYIWKKHRSAKNLVIKAASFNVSPYFFSSELAMSSLSAMLGLKEAHEKNIMSLDSFVGLDYESQMMV